LFHAGIYIGWVGYLNSGDEVLYDLCRARYPSISWSLFDTLDCTVRPSQFLHRSTRDFHHVVAQLAEEMVARRRLRSYARKAIHELVRRMGTEVGMCGGGTWTNRNQGALRAYTQLRRRIRRPVPTFGTGVAFSDFWKGREKGRTNRRKEWVAALAERPVVGVRGSLSKAQLEDRGAHNVVVSADPAVALHASYATRWKPKRDGRPVRLGINAGDCQGRLFGHKEALQDALASAARWLRKSGHHVEIIPVWVKDVEACNDVARRAKLDPSLVSPVCYSRCISQSARATGLAGVAKAACWHPRLRCQRALREPGIPSECRDFASSLRWEGFLIRTDQLDKGARIERIPALISQLDGKRTDLCRRMCCLRQSTHCCSGQCWISGWLAAHPIGTLNSGGITILSRAQNTDK
jgi:hypothetical protein